MYWLYWTLCTAERSKLYDLSSYLRRYSFEIKKKTEVKVLLRVMLHIVKPPIGRSAKSWQNVFVITWVRYTAFCFNNLILAWLFVRPGWRTSFVLPATSLVRSSIDRCSSYRGSTASRAMLRNRILFPKQKARCCAKQFHCGHTCSGLWSLRATCMAQMLSCVLLFSM